MRHATLALLVLMAAAATAAAQPPALIWRVAGPEGAALLPPRFAALVVELDAAAGASLLSASVAEAPLKLRPRAPRGDGLFFVVRDAAGTPLLAGESFDARFELHGDEPDPVSGTLRSLSVMRDKATFALRVPLLPGASDVALFVLADPRQEVTAGEIMNAVRSGSASMVPRGVLPLPGPAAGTAP